MLQTIKGNQSLLYEDESDNKTVAAVDCLVPGIGEIIGGSQREDDYDKLVARMEELGLKKRIMASIWICANTVLPVMPVLVWALSAA